MVKSLAKSILYFIIMIITSTILITILNYFNIVNNNVINILKFIFPIVATIVSSFILGKNSKEKGYLEGLKLGAIITIVFFILNLLIDKFNIRTIIYYIIIIFTSILSSMVGINKRKQ